MIIPPEFEGDFIVVIIKKDGKYKVELCNNEYDVKVSKGQLTTELRDYRGWELVKRFDGVNEEFYRKTQEYVKTLTPEKEIFGVSDIVIDKEYINKTLKRLKG